MLVGCIVIYASPLKMMINPYTTATFMVPTPTSSDYGSGPNNPIPHSNLIDNFNINSNWYVVGEASEIKKNVAHRVDLLNVPIAIWKSSNNAYGAISDICTHRGASLSCGRIDDTLNTLVCPYHTFKYNTQGQLVQIPGQTSVRSNSNFNFRTDVPHYPIVEKEGWVYILKKPLYELSELSMYNNPHTIWCEPETTDPTFKCVYMSKIFNQDARTVTENSLDILHISEVHSFGNKERPLPVDDNMEQISNGHWRASYTYESGANSYASKLFGVKTLQVENEYILPHTTVARVVFGDFTNTIITSAQPISPTKTRLFVKAYRNNWVFNIPLLDYIFDKFSSHMMEKTLLEDKSVIDTIYPTHRNGNFITKYDELVKKYREDYATINQRM